MAEHLPRIEEEMNKLRKILVERFTNNNSTQKTNHSQIRELLYNFSKPFTQHKVEVNKYIRNNIQLFINQHVKTMIGSVDKLAQDQRRFVKVLNEVWSQFQVFIFSFYHVTDKFTEFYASFYKMNNGKDYEYQTKNSKKRYEVAPVSVIGVNELKECFDQMKIIDKFKTVFNDFLKMEREGKDVPHSEIRESIHSLQSCYFDMNASTKLGIDKNPVIYKKEEKMEKLSANRFSKDHEFFKKHLLDETLRNLKEYYERWVDLTGLNLNATDENTKMIGIVKQQEARAQYYIHTKDNYQEYINVLNENLIKRKIENRITKEDGFKKYIEQYDDKKEEWAKEIKDIWTIYSRIPNVSVPMLRDLFANYLFSQAEKIAEKTKKPPDFIEELIRVNAKCIKIVEFCGNNFELENERNNKIRGILSNDITEKGRKQAKFDIGAKNLASYINNKFKMSYSKGGLESLGELYKQIVSLFKILQEKTRFIDEESKYMSSRLLEDIQFSKDLEVGQIITLEKSFIQEMQKQCGVSEVKELIENIKDIQKSIENNTKIKNKIAEQIKYPLNQIIVKNNNFWPEKNTYIVEVPPKLLQKSYNSLMEYFKNQNTNILFEFNTGVSMFQGDFRTGKKQRFQLKNLYLMILLFVDEKGKLLFGELKKLIEASGINKQKGVIELARAVIELLFSGLLVSSTKSLQPGTPNICKLRESDELQINKKYDFVEEEKRKKGGKGPVPKPMAIIKGSILTLSEELKKGFDQQVRALNDDEKRIQAERKFKVECITVKSLKHAHHHHMNCTFEQLFKGTQEGRNKEFRCTEKYLKEIVEELINKKYCERIEGQRNVFRYIA